MKQALYKHIANKFTAMQTCNSEWYDKHTKSIESLVANYMPSGAGIDAGTIFDYDASKPDKLVFVFSYHHMVDGMYDGWTDHKLIVTPSLVHGFEMRITGRDRNEIKDYLYQVYQEALSQEVEE